MIQAASESVWSNVGFVARIEAIDKIMLLESVEPLGVRTVALSKYLTDYDSQGHAYKGGLAIIRHKHFEERVDTAKLRELISFAVSWFGYPHDTDEIAKIAARILASKIPFGPDEMERIQPDREFICSEFVARCYDHIGLPVDWNQLGFVAPADFAADPNFELVGVIQKRPDAKQTATPKRAGAPRTAPRTKARRPDTRARPKRRGR